MAAKPVKVAFIADTADLQSGLGKAQAAMDSAAATASTAGQKIESSFNNAGAAADGVASTSAQVAGGLGDLGGALEATGFISEGTAQSMNVASAAIMGVTGVSDLANAAFEKLKLGTLASKAATIAHTVATNAATVAQKALNLALRANPIGLVVTAIALLVGALVVAYNKNEAFRELVDKVWGKVKDVVDTAKTTVVNFASTAGEKIGTVGATFGTLRDKATSAIGSYSGDGGGVLGKLYDIVSTVGGMGATITSKAAGMWDGIGTAFKGVINNMIGWWNNLSFSVDIPDKIPGLPPSFTISTPNIPYLATGGIVTRPTLAVVGEAGPEAVIPLSKMGGFGGGTLVVKVDLGAEQMAQLERGRRVAADLRAYTSAGGKL